MKKLQTVISILLLISALGTVNAAMFQTDNPGGSFDLGTGWVGQGDLFTLNIDWSVNAGFANQTFNLNYMDTVTLDFGTATFGSEFFISSYFDETDNLGITANVNLTAPEVLGFSSIGLVGTVAGFTCDIGFFPCILGAQDMSIEDVSIVFANTQVEFGSTGILGLAMSTINFTDDNTSSNITATFTLLQEDEDTLIANPIPPSFLLMGSGLLGIMGLTRRRKTKV